MDGAQIMICGVCHTRVHNAAHQAHRGEFIDEPDAAWLARAQPVINRIVRAMIEAEDRDLSQVPSRIILKIPKALLKLVHLRKKDQGFASLEKYLMNLIVKDLARR